MLFNSLSFAIFLPIVFALHWILPHKFRWILLLIASYYFYMSWSAKYVALIFVTTAVSWITAQLIAKAQTPRRKKTSLAVCVLICIGILIVFKYTGFFMDTLTDTLRLFSIPMHEFSIKIILPVGISFYTFQTLSYVIDVYRGKQEPEKHFGLYALYVSWFPQLVAGPIERPQNLIPQITRERRFCYEQAAYGLRLMAVGFFKKLVLATIMAKHVDPIFYDVTSYSGFTLVLAIFFFAIQIYCDFSGYSDIAIGASKLFGINLMTNFSTPYFSTSFKEFWKRWHISLSTWFRDYVYIPLGGSKVSRWRHRRNIAITFLLSGFWHGANWTFVLWGGLHGVFLICEDALRHNLRFEMHTSKAGRICINFLKMFLVFALTCFAWIFFRADSISDIAYILTHLSYGITSPISYLTAPVSSMSLDSNETAFIVIPLCILLLYDALSNKIDPLDRISARPMLLRYAVYVFSLMAILIFSDKGMPQDFIYFQF